jgi:hypothetical protein
MILELGRVSEETKGIPFSSTELVPGGTVPGKKN